MNRGEAAEVLDHLTASYIRVEMDRRTIDAWLRAFQESGAEFSQGLRTARTWALTHERFPSLAEFLVAITPRRAYTADEDRPEIDPDVSQRIGRLWRDALAQVDKRAASSPRGGHWHGTKGEPCPICGGSRP